MTLLTQTKFSKPIIEFRPTDGVLGVTMGAGAGHIMTMEAVKKDFNSQKTNGYYHAVDVIQGSFPRPLKGVMGRITTNDWNQAKKEGNIKKQEQNLKGKILGVTRQRLADIIFFLPVFLATFFRLICNGKITHIVDTQPVATNALIKAARLVNFLFVRNIKVVKVMTDLPTPEAIHYSACSLRMSREDKKVYQLVSAHPFKRHTGETDNEYLARQESWWNEQFGLSLIQKQVRYADFPIRPAFKVWANKSKQQRINTINIKINHRDEFLMVGNSIRGRYKKEVLPKNSEREKEKEVVTLDLESDEIVGMITLGSQAAKKTFNYVENFINQVRNSNDPDKKYCLFVACGAYIKGKPSLLKNVYQLCRNAQLTDNIRIIPFGFQDDEEFAPMMHRADFGIYGTGGITCMEANSVATGHVFLHSEKNISEEEMQKISPRQLNEKLQEGFALWEKGNAQYLEQMQKACIITPGRLFEQTLKEKMIVSA